MKKIITMVFVTFTVLCHGQQNSYNDWFDFNLQGQPKSTKEITIFSLVDTLFFNETQNLKRSSTIEEYQFDSIGNIVKKRSKWYLSPPSDNWIDYSYKDVSNYKDSLITFYNFCGVKIESKKYFDNYGYLAKEIYNKCDTSVFSRDSYHRIKTSYMHFYGTDSESIIMTDNEYNLNGDICKENKYVKNFGLSYEESGPSIHENVYDYKYFYDSKNNWIIKVTFENNNISSITQREIKYK